MAFKNHGHDSTGHHGTDNFIIRSEDLEGNRGGRGIKSHGASRRECALPHARLADARMTSQRVAERVGAPLKK